MFFIKLICSLMVFACHTDVSKGITKEETLSGVFYLADTIRPALEVLDSAMAKAKNTDKNIFLMFRSSLCGWCRRMDSLMNDDRCKQLFEKEYVVSRINIWEGEGRGEYENRDGAKLFREFAGPAAGVPYWLVMNSAGVILNDSRMKDSLTTGVGKNIGCPVSENEIDYLINVLRSTSRMKTEELESIKSCFLKKKRI